MAGAADDGDIGIFNGRWRAGAAMFGRTVMCSFSPLVSTNGRNGLMIAS